MAQRNTADLIAGAVVLVVAIGFLGYALANTGRGLGGGGYTLHAAFDSVDGLSVGSDVRVAGVKVGDITSMRIDPDSYRADVNFTVADNIKLPKDSDAAVVSDGLLGGKYLRLRPGGDTAMLAPGGEITLTQPSINIEDLLGKFVIGGGVGDSSTKPAGGTAPAKPK